MLQESTGAAVVRNKKRNPVSSWFPGPQSCILMHLLHLTTGNEITRSSGVSLCLAGKGCTGIAPATKTSSGRPCWCLWCPLPGTQTLPGRQALGGLVSQRFAGSSRAWREAYERIGVSWSRDRGVGQLGVTRADLSFGLT